MPGRDLVPLVYGTEVIHERGEMLSLTDMWRAAGSLEDRRPAEWLRSADAQRFIEALSVMTDVGNSHTALVDTKKGGPRQGTWAHWQIALAYAKYLSPEFHMWCNTVVRERMEAGRIPALPADVVELVRRTDGIARQLSGKVAEMQRRLEALANLKPVAALDFGSTVSAYQVIETAGVPVEDRQRGTAQMVTRRLIAFCAERQIACFRTPAEVSPSRPYRFPREVVSEWLLGPMRGLELIRAQVAKMKAKKAKRGSGGGQGSLRLIP